MTGVLRPDHRFKFVLLFALNPDGGSVRLSPILLLLLAIGAILPGCGYAGMGSDDGPL